MQAGPGKTGAVTVLGAMSGTSLDGADAAVLVTDGRGILDFGPSRYRPYTDAERDGIRAALGQWDGPAVAAAAQIVEHAHIELLSQFAPVDLVGFHGQTLAHAPAGRGTLQAGNGAALADALGVPVVWDFRSTDVRLGGEGAPLAPFYHFACARHIGADAPLAFLNLGGVGNLTYVDPRLPEPEMPGALLAFDTGPANAPIDDLLRARCGVPYDKDGSIARQGSVAQGVLEVFLADPYFEKLPPKSLDRDDFAQITALVADLNDADAAATLAAICAAGVLDGIRHCPTPPERLLVTGGGRRNPVLMEMISSALDCPVAPVEDVGLDGDMLEAQAFAFLAVRVARGLPTTCPGTTGVPTAVGGGMISQPVSQTRAAQG